MKRALKQAKAYRDKLLQLSTADYELRKADSEFIGCSFKIDKDLNELCPVCQDEMLSGKNKQVPVSCDICGEYFYPEATELMPFCPSCQEEQCR